MGTPAEPDALLADGTRVGDFRIRGLLGEGAMGQVYLAQDLKLGRRVALKLIKRSVMQGDAPERFLEEARTTASFNHPHIVTLHAVGEHEGRPYLALEYLDGESIRTRLAAGPLPVREALRCARAVAEAIAEAHRRGLVHADLKPENIVIPRDGRVRVVDFGLAKLAGGPIPSASGTPAYMAPERWRGQPLTGAIDVWAFGITLHELITGRRPMADAQLLRMPFSKAPLDLSALPAAPWAPLVRACLAREPAERPTADELVRRITALLDPRAGGADDEGRCPFPGLASFTRDDAALYFGRRAELDALVEQLRTRALVPVVGPSGIGKSSFIRAALLPRLEDADRWIPLALRPGPSPFDALAAALALPHRPAAQIAEALRASPDSLSLVLSDVAAHHGGRVLLFLDQFEEAFTLAPSEAEATRLCECLARAAAPAEPWRILLTLRDDFLGRLAASPAMRPHLGAVMLLPPLSSADLRAAVAGPLASADYEADTAGLVSRIVDDVAGQPACLPLLQFTCRSLWERRDVATRRILTAEYEAMGGATGALAAHAQRLLTELTPDQVRVVRNILLSLVHPDGTRRPRLRAELLDAVPADARETADRMLDRLLERRLLAATRDADRGDTTIEVAHEALATAWPQLARWLDETYEERVIVAELEQASQAWQRRGRRDGETWGGIALAETIRKVGEWNITLPSSSRAFLDASVERDRRVRRRRRFLISGAIALIGAAVIAAIAVTLAFARNEQERRRVAEENWGEFDLELEPFDWDPAAQRRTPPEHPPQLSWQLHASSSSRERGRLYGAADLQRGTLVWRAADARGAGAFVERIRARSGPAIFEISRGPGCAPSRVFVQQLPSYLDRRARGTGLLRIPVPTCQATRADMIKIPGGPFYANVDVDERISDEGTVDVLRDLPLFTIDRTEVTIEAFEVYATLEPLTGDGTGVPGLQRAGAGGLPITSINYSTAKAYCEFLGKVLPSVEEWQKAFRGGLTLPGGRDNPEPRRLTPWLEPFDSPAVPANLGTGSPAPSEAYPIDTSPYGVRHMAGNVSEWTRTMVTDPEFYGYRVVLGGYWQPPSQGDYRPIHQVDHRNVRFGRYLDYLVGMRCVTPPAGTSI